MFSSNGPLRWEAQLLLPFGTPHCRLRQLTPSGAGRTKRWPARSRKALRGCAGEARQPKSSGESFGIQREAAAPLSDLRRLRSPQGGGGHSGQSRGAFGPRGSSPGPSQSRDFRLAGGRGRGQAAGATQRSFGAGGKLRRSRQRPSAFGRPERSREPGPPARAFGPERNGAAPVRNINGLRARGELYGRPLSPKKPSGFCGARGSGNSGTGGSEPSSQAWRSDNAGIVSSSEPAEQATSDSRVADLG